MAGAAPPARAADCSCGWAVSLRPRSVLAERPPPLPLPYRFDPSGLPEASWNRIPRVCAKMHAVVLIFVMAGLDPAIHVYPAATLSRRGCPARGRASRDSIDPAGLQA